MSFDFFKPQTDDETTCYDAICNMFNTAAEALPNMSSITETLEGFGNYCLNLLDQFNGYAKDCFICLFSVEVDGDDYQYTPTKSGNDSDNGNGSGRETEDYVL